MQMVDDEVESALRAAYAASLSDTAGAGGWDDAGPAYDDDGDDGAAQWDGGASAQCCLLCCRDLNGTRSA